MAAVSMPSVLFIVISIAAIIADTTTASSSNGSNRTTATVLRISHLGEHNACCSGDNIADENGICVTGEKGAGAMACDLKYLLDPNSYPDDQFRSSKHGLEYGDGLIENGRYVFVINIKQR